MMLWIDDSVLDSRMSDTILWVINLAKLIEPAHAAASSYQLAATTLKPDRTATHLKYHFAEADEG
jgi:hypothetical protein